jgi:hypothetical protein
MAGALIVTAELAPPTAWLDGCARALPARAQSARRASDPVPRLPPSLEEELRQRLAALAAELRRRRAPTSSG